MRKRPLFSVVLMPSAPMKDERLSTAGSFKMTWARACCRSAIALKEMVWSRLGNALDHAGILHREKSLGHDHIKQDREQPASRRQPIK